MRKGKKLKKKEKEQRKREDGKSYSGIEDHKVAMYRIRKVAESQNGQVSIDFLLAISIFTLGLVILISHIPLLFTPLQTVSTDIQPVAYRTSMILVEDGGIYEKNENITSRWEDPEGNGWNYTQNTNNIPNYHGNVKRIGLAMPVPGWSSSEDIIPNNLSRDKIESLQDWWEDKANRSKIRDKLGLSVTYNGNRLNYNYNISLRNFSDELRDPLLKIGYSIPERGVTVEKIERIVAVDCANCTRIGDVRCAKLVICIWR
ncbi:MAG: DUF7287 family protein [Candidatus Methanospirareceae archaeon]